MSLFDLLFIVLFLTSLGVVLIILARFTSGRRGEAIAMLRRLLAGWAIYMTIVAGTSLLLPQRVVGLKEPRCFDDWCISILGAEPPAEGQLRVSVEIASRAGRVSQREKDIRLYLADEAGSLGGPGRCALDDELGPGESREMTCLFAYPDALKQPAVAIKHEDGFPIGWFIIGYETWFRKPTIVHLS